MKIINNIDLNDIKSCLGAKIIYTYGSKKTTYIGYIIGEDGNSLVIFSENINHRWTITNRTEGYILTRKINNTIINHGWMINKKNVILYENH